MNPFVHEFYVNLRSGAAQERARKELSQGDAYADKLIIHVQDCGEDVALDGMGVSAKVIRYDGQTVPLTGRVEDGAACVTLDKACYAVPGEIRVTVSVSVGEMVQTVLVLLLNVSTSATSVVVDNGVIGDLTSIMAALAEMQSVTAEAQETVAEAKATMDEVQVQAEALLGGGVPASAIIVDTDGAVVSVTDAASRNVQAVRSVITAVQAGSGTPSPENVRPITGWDAVSLWREANYDEAAEQMLTTDLPETIYGGVLNWTTGVLTVTHVHYRLAVADMNAPYEKYPGWNGVPDLRKHMGALNVTTGIASAWGQIGINTISASNAQIILQGGTLQQSEWKATYPDLVMDFVIPINNTYDLQLTPQQLALLKGRNSLWSNTGSTELSYIADTRLYIDNAVAALAAGIINQ